MKEKVMITENDEKTGDHFDCTCPVCCSVDIDEKEPSELLSTEKEELLEWIKIKKQLPPKNTLVWVKRMANKVEQEPMYLAMRNGSELSENPDASCNCHWYGIHTNALGIEQKSSNRLEFNSSFSDITVIEWAFVKRPSLKITDKEYKKLMKALYPKDNSKRFSR